MTDMLILGIADLLSALLLIRGIYHVAVPGALVFVFALYLLIKAIMFISDIGSWMDIVAGLLLVLSLTYSMPTFILLAFAVLIGLKGAMSLFAGIH